MAKRLGYSDRQLSALLKASDDDVRARRIKDGILPRVKQVGHGGGGGMPVCRCGARGGAGVQVCGGWYNR
jgi:hypothetical protein